MTVKTYNEILEDLCNNFDSLISPKSIKRANSNVIYLMFKAISKSLEVINNVVVTLDSKFDPALCEDSDLESVAKLVGTERQAGSGSGLAITVTNPTLDPIVLPEGEYTYSLDSDTDFIFTVNAAVTVYPVTETVSDSTKIVRYIAMTRNVGSFPVTRQERITVTGKQEDVAIEINPNLIFSNADNATLLGRLAETTNEFRTRILESSTRQNVIEELEARLQALPYIINCKIVFNQTNTNVSYGDFTIPPYTMLLNIDGDVTPEVAEIVASYGIYPTLQTADGKLINFETSVFASGNYPIYYRYFDRVDYTVDIVYNINRNFTNPFVVENAVTNAVLAKMNDNQYKQIIKEGDIYDTIKTLNLKAFTLYSVELKQNGIRQAYIEVPKTAIAFVSDVTYTEKE